MKLSTKHFGEIDVEQNKVINFSEGLPGFAHLKDFVLMADPEKSADGLFYYLQSVEDPSTAFILVDMIGYNPDYNPLVEEMDINGLGNYNPESFRVYNIAVVGDDVSDMTVNLKAPVVINTEAKKGKQVICTNDEYTIRHFMFK